jgi:hypothetical protein
MAVCRREAADPRWRSREARGAFAEAGAAHASTVGVDATRTPRGEIVDCIR